MATYTIRINDRTNKTKYLLGLISELAKTESKYISVYNDNNRPALDRALEDVKQGRVHKAKNAKDLIEQCSHTPNAETEKALLAVNRGEVTKTKNKQDFFNKI